MLVHTVSRHFSKTAYKGKPRVVIIGSGWGGFMFAKSLKRKNFNTIMVSPRNHFLFTPLLPSTTVGTLEFSSIQEPVRTIKGLNYMQAECKSVDFENKSLRVEMSCTNEIHEVDYDKLIIACGMRSRTYSTPGVSQENHVYFLKNLWDSRMIRTRLMECFERASNPFLPGDERRRLLTFIVVGGGPTSVEFAGELNQFIKEDVKKWYPELYLESDRKSTRLNSSHSQQSRMPSSA